MIGDNRTATHRTRPRPSPESTTSDSTREKSRRKGVRGPHHQRCLGGPIHWTFLSLLLIGSLVYYITSGDLGREKESSWLREWILPRTSQSLIFGMMWLGIRNGQYYLRHVCQESDELSMYGWVEHNGRDYGRRVLRDNSFHIETSFLKHKGEDSGFGGDWTVRIDVDSEVIAITSSLDLCPLIIPYPLTDSA